MFRFPAMFLLLLPAFAWGSPHNKQPTKAVKMAPQRALGHRLAELEKAGKYEDAAKLLRANLGSLNAPEISNLRFAQLACKTKESSLWRKAINALGTTALTQNTQLMSELWGRVEQEQDKIWLSEKLKSWNFFEPRSEGSCVFFELEQRKKRGEFLKNLLDFGPKEKIWHELYILLPETVNHQEYSKNNDFREWQKKLQIKDFLTRITNLTLFGKNVEARETIEDARLILSNLVPNLENNLKHNLDPMSACELDYEDAKIDRKLRRYKNARARFQELVERSCSEDTVRKSRYMDLMLASMANDLESLEKFDSFVVDYPTHGFSDDVLLFKAMMYLEKKDIPQALKTLEKIEALYAQGDMIDRALFVKAFIFADLDQTSAALVELKKLKEKTKPQQLEHAQAEYWIARLMLFPKLTNLEATPKKNPKAIAMLTKLSRSEHITVYSWLAAELLGSMGIKKNIKKQLPISNRPKNINIIAKNNNLKLITTLIKHGFDSEALALLNEDNAQYNDKADLGAMAQAYIKLGRPELGHQKLIKCSESRAQILKQNWPDMYRNISWPRPYYEEVREAGTQLKIPQEVIYAIMRQESCFLPGVLSWAGAHGLMQVVENTAKEQAIKLKIKQPELDELFEPRLNLLLGSSAFSHYWQRFEHLAVALCAYNAGPTAALRWSRENNAVDTLIEKISYKETRAYVKNVLGSAYAYDNQNKIELKLKLRAVVP